MDRTTAAGGDAYVVHTSGSADLPWFEAELNRLLAAIRDHSHDGEHDKLAQEIASLKDEVEADEQDIELIQHRLVTVDRVARATAFAAQVATLVVHGQALFP